MRLPSHPDLLIVPTNQPTTSYHLVFFFPFPSSIRFFPVSWKRLFTCLSVHHKCLFVFCVPITDTSNSLCPGNICFSYIVSVCHQHSFRFCLLPSTFNIYIYRYIFMFPTRVSGQNCFLSAINTPINIPSFVSHNLFHAFFFFYSHTRISSFIICHFPSSVSFGDGVRTSIHLHFTSSWCVTASSSGSSVCLYRISNVVLRKLSR